MEQKLVQRCETKVGANACKASYASQCCEYIANIHRTATYLKIKHMQTDLPLLWPTPSYIVEKNTLFLFEEKKNIFRTFMQDNKYNFSKYVLFF